MQQQNLFKGRDRRQKGWFWMDNDYLNGYAKIFGAVGTAIYVSLCRHADNDTQKCFPAMDLMAEELGISRNTISKYIKLFEKHHLISIEKERDFKTKKWLNNVYTLLDKEIWDSHAQIVGTDSHAQITNEPCTNNNDSHAQQLCNKETNNNKTNIKETHTIEINKIINLFKEINPSYKLFFKRLPQRGAISRMLDIHGFEMLSKVISYLPQSNSIAYLPTITSPVKLEEKWADLESGIKKIKNKSLSNFRGLEV